MERTKVTARRERCLAYLPADGLSGEGNALSAGSLKPLPPHEYVHKAIEAGTFVLCDYASLEVGILAVGPTTTMKVQEDVLL